MLCVCRLYRFSDGAERLCSVLNSFFATLIQIVTDYGGDVVKFAGDAVCVIFPIDESQPVQNFVANSFQLAVARAVQCSIELHEVLIFCLFLILLRSQILINLLSDTFLFLTEIGQVFGF